MQLGGTTKGGSGNFSKPLQNPFACNLTPPCQCAFPGANSGHWCLQWGAQTTSPTGPGQIGFWNFVGVAVAWWFAIQPGGVGNDGSHTQSGALHHASPRGAADSGFWWKGCSWYYVSARGFGHDRGSDQSTEVSGGGKLQPQEDPYLNPPAQFQ